MIVKKYHVATGDGKSYYGIGYESYRQAESLLKISQEHDPQAHIVEEEYILTKADQIRSMSDEQIAEAFYNLVDNLQTGTMNDLSDLYCDGKNGCIDKDGNITCTPDMEKTCVLRWLRSPAKEETGNG